MKLKDKIAIVTGGGRGIGRAIALLCAEHGAKIVITARTAEQVAGVVNEIRAAGGEAIGVPCDVSVEADAKEMVEQTVNRFGGADILVNNAGITMSAPLVASDSEQWRRVIEINLLGTFYCSKAIAPILIEKGWGRIINMASRSGKMGHPFLTAYVASKHGVVGFTKALSEELAPFRITVNAICPGVVETDMIPDVIREQVGDKIIRPRQIADLALFLASDDSSAITGEAINIYGNTKLNLSM
ncbi:MAG: SDR family oxidoreductase [Candidatus Lindowbacteria bacterium]|nr:SDR family oxidoreductase [Candidatus Lindowbacteria bacterium]